MQKFIVTQSFSSVKIGSHAEGETVELTPEEYKDHAPFLKPVGKADEAPAPVIETADMQPAAETAVVNAPRKKRTKG